MPNDKGRDETVNTPADSSNSTMILYMHPGSYYSRIVLLAMHAKGLTYRPHFVDVFTRENLHPWFLKLNPQGQLPVLQDGDKVIPGSDVIIHHLEEKFCNDGVPKLLPPDGTADFQKVQSLVQLLRTFQSSILTYGVINFPSLSSGFTMKEYERIARLELLHHSEKFFNQIQEQFPEMSEFISEKKKSFPSLYGPCLDIASVQRSNVSTEAILEQIESQLASNGQNRNDCWLCGENFTEADVTLAILLHRLDELGITSQFTGPSKRPLLYKFKQRLQKSVTFQAYLDDLESLYSQVCAQK